MMNIDVQAKRTFTVNGVHSRASEVKKRAQKPIFSALQEQRCTQRAAAHDDVFGKICYRAYDACVSK